jgi:hypothetical protein
VLQTSYSTSLFMRNVTSRNRLKELAQLYGPDEWDALGAEAVAKAGDLVEVDLMYLQVGAVGVEGEVGGGGRGIYGGGTG